MEVLRALAAQQRWSADGPRTQGRCSSAPEGPCGMRGGVMTVILQPDSYFVVLSPNKRAHGVSMQGSCAK